MDEKARIKRIMEIEGLNNSQFANEVGIPASTISHIRTGRNKMSSDVAKKILNRFRTISPEWLISGVGSIHRQENNSQQPDLFGFGNETVYKSAISQPEFAQNFEQEQISSEKKNVAESTLASLPPINMIARAEKPPRKIKRIIVYFDDNSFQEFNEMV
ncbi:MAG: helix-turn-helix domain-containing protein [Bacteroidetes bacterium]|nr:helix-turn-helix domain-containing protein [Bacteroidota bacterium]